MAVSLARASLIYEWRRYLPALFAVAFAGVMMLVQLGLLLGMFGSVSIYISKSTADLWVGFRDAPSVDMARDIPARNEVFVRMHPAVKDVESFRWGGGDWRRADGIAIGGFLVGVDTRLDGMTFGRLLTPELRRILYEPATVLIDEADLNKLGTAVGSTAELNGKRVRVGGTVSGLRAIGGANTLASLATTRFIDSSTRDTDSVAFFLVKLNDPRRAEEVRDALQPRGNFRPYSVWTANELAHRSTLYWLLESGAGAGFMFSSLLALIVGIVITSQTLMAATAAAIREYATLRALGVARRSLRAVVIEQAAWLGVLGFVIATGLSLLALWIAQENHVSMDLPWVSFPLTGLLLLLIAISAGLFSLRALNSAEPATLLR